MKINDIELTKNEAELYNAIEEGMDEPKCGWLHEVCPFEGLKLSGVVSSLVKKGLIETTEHEDDCIWVTTFDCDL